MGMTIPGRFQVIRFFRKDRMAATFLATDDRLGRNEVVVRILKTRAAETPGGSIGALLWYRGLRHSLISEILDAGLTAEGDVFYVRPCHPASEFFSVASHTAFK